RRSAGAPRCGGRTRPSPAPAAPVRVALRASRAALRASRPCAWRSRRRRRSPLRAAGSWGRCCHRRRGGASVGYRSAAVRRSVRSFDGIALFACERGAQRRELVQALGVARRGIACGALLLHVVRPHFGDEPARLAGLPLLAAPALLAVAHVELALRA